MKLIYTRNVSGLLSSSELKSPSPHAVRGLPGRVDPDDVQVAEVVTLSVHLVVAGAAFDSHVLGSHLGREFRLSRKGVSKP